jgi:hypothetical protein
MIDINKKYRTRDGREVRIYATDGGGRNAIHGAIKMENGWIYQIWPKGGRYFEDEDGDEVEEYWIDLIEVRPRHKRTMWVNIYEKSDNVTAYDEKWKADQSGATRIACIKVELDFAEGEGL